MKPSARLPLLLAGLLYLAQAQAADLAGQISVRLSPAQLVRGQFEQQKTVNGFAKPLLSSGDFLLWKAHGILWQTRKPYASTLRITRNSLQGWQDAHPERKDLQLDARNEPALKAVNTLLFAVFSGDVKALQKGFRLEGSLRGAQDWQITLTPTEAGLSRVIRYAALEGGRHVRQITLVDQQGDQSVIRLSKLVEAGAPTPAEARSFAE